MLVYDPFAKLDAGDDVEHVELAELLRRSNVVSLHARETKESRGILGAREIALMPKGSVVVNCARGPLVDYDALGGLRCAPDTCLRRRRMFLRRSHCLRIHRC